jgi:hypothetical protein
MWPMKHGARGLERRTGAVSPTEFDFISTAAQIGDARMFMRKLPTCCRAERIYRAPVAIAASRACAAVAAGEQYRPSGPI